jgi:hypothetical protein
LALWWKNIWSLVRKQWNRNKILSFSLNLIFRGTKWLLMWHNFRRFYLYAMTENMKSIVLRHRKVLLSEDMRKKHKLNERDIFSAATLPELDEAYTR